MKRFITLLLIITLNAISSFAQDRVETVKSVATPTELTRYIANIDIEGDIYCDVSADIEATPKDRYAKPSVKVKIKDAKTGKVIWSKKLDGSYLFLFSDGQIQIGKQDLRQVVISRPGEDCAAKIRVKQGIWM